MPVSTRNMISKKKIPINDDICKLNQFSIIDFPKDGNCLFSCFSHHNKGFGVEKWRNKCVIWILEMWDVFIPLFQSTIGELATDIYNVYSKEEYSDKMSSTSNSNDNWGGILEQYAFCNINMSTIMTFLCQRKSAGGKWIHSYPSHEKSVYRLFQVLTPIENNEITGSASGITKSEDLHLLWKKSNKYSNPHYLVLNPKKQSII